MQGTRTAQHGRMMASNSSAARSIGTRETRRVRSRKWGSKRSWQRPILRRRITPTTTTMQNQITNQLLLFGIRPGEYQITTHPTGEIEITVAGNAVAVIPPYGLQLNRGWVLGGMSFENLPLVVSAVVAALLRCRHTGGTAPHTPTLPAPRVWCALCGKWGDHGSGSCPHLAGNSLERTTLALSLSMVENTSPPCGGEVTIPRLGIYPTDNHSPEDYE